MTFVSNTTPVVVSISVQLKCYRIVQLFPVVLVRYLHSFLKLDHERELGEDGQISLFRHGELWRL